MNSRPNEFGPEPAREDIDLFPSPLLLQFGANWCSHCQAAQPLVRQALEKFPHISHIMVEDGKGKPLGRSFQVKLWPSLIFIKEGKEIGRLVRPENQTEIESFLSQLGN